jgi:hypothetical protein
MAEQRVRHRADHEAALSDAKRRWAPQLRRAADELLDQGTTRVVLGERTLDAQLIRFWRGDLCCTPPHADRTGAVSRCRTSAGTHGEAAPTSSSSTRPEPQRRGSPHPGAAFGLGPSTACAQISTKKTLL